MTGIIENFVSLNPRNCIHCMIILDYKQKRSNDCHNFSSYNHNEIPIMMKLSMIPLLLLLLLHFNTSSEIQTQHNTNSLNEIVFMK